MGTDRAFAAGEAAAFPLSGPQAARRPASVQGILFVLHNRDRLGASAARARLWLRHDGLAAESRLAAVRSVGERLHELQLAELHAFDQLECERAIAESNHCRQKRGAKTGPRPVDRGRPGSKHHLLVDAGGIPTGLDCHGRQPQ